MSELNDFPFEIHNLEAAVSDELKKYYLAYPNGFIRVGSEGYFYPRKYKAEGPLIYNMEVRPSDIFVVTCPRSGTTWTQELVWLIANDLDYAKAKTEKLNERFPFLELSISLDEKFLMKMMNETKEEEKKKQLSSRIQEQSYNKVFAATSPRFIKSHLPLSLLPPTMLDTAKVIYVARDPRDVAVSFFHMNKNLAGLGCQDFKTYWKYFKNGLTQWGPYFPHVKEAWEKRNHPNMLFLFYEELSKDLAAVVKRVADFLGKSLSEEKINELCQHLHFDNFKKNNSVSGGYLKETFSASENFQFIRNGKSGGWRSYFDEEMTREAEEWMSENMRDTDFCFSHIGPVRYDTKIIPNWTCFKSFLKLISVSVTSNVEDKFVDLTVAKVTVDVRF